jgi:predicted adenine nucleotide alpha hydrolase (AANH) superfamily ATPase
MNYHLKMTETIANLEGTPSLLLHSCCAPCSTAVIAALAPAFRITVFYYNPNIDDREEYDKRAREQERLVSLIPAANPISFLEGDYNPEDFLVVARPYADEREGGKRCSLCYALRLDRTAREAVRGTFDYFATTLSISPLKDAERINSIGSALGEKYGVQWLWSDFKKKDGYRTSVELSKEYGLYRQNYCGCSFSRRVLEREITG